MKTLILILFTVSAILSDDTIHFVTPQFKPFTYLEENQLKGVGIERVTTLFQELNIPITFSVVPNYGRAVEDVRQNKYDGFFLATQNDERDSIAIFSHPIMMNKWCWFTLLDQELTPLSPQFKQNAQVSTVLNTNTHKWLKKNQYNISFATNDKSAILRLLIAKKVDAIFIAEEVFLQLLRDQGVPRSSVQSFTQSQKPFGLYLSRKKAAQNPDLIRQINSVIDSLYNSEDQ